MSLTDVLGSGGYIIAGIFVVLGMFGMSSRTRRKENDGLADTLITNLQRTVDVQKTEISQLQTQREEQGKEIAHLQGRLSVMMEILQGRDPLQAAFFKESPMLFAIARENKELAEKTNESVGHMALAVENFINTFSASMPKVVA